VLVDSAEEIYWSSLPAEIHQQSDDLADELRASFAAGKHGEMIRDWFVEHVEKLSADPHIRELFFQAYEASYSTRDRIEAFPAEFAMLNSSIAAITSVRTSTPLPDVPVVVLSATLGALPEHRATWTGLHARLAASMPQGQHLVLEKTGHAVNEDRPEAVVAAIETVLAAL
jgi:pimeloyl-ACP methyl ester carboxylesterase